MFYHISRRCSLAMLLSLMLLYSCEKPSEKPVLKLYPVHFSQIPYWQLDKLSEILPPLQAACQMAKKSPNTKALLLNVTMGDFQAACQHLNENMNDTETKMYLEKHFTPYQVSDQGNKKAFMTGYYIPTIKGSLKKDKTYPYPVYGKPTDLVLVEDLSLFRPETEFKNKRIAGRVINGYLKPYYTREEIQQGKLRDKAKTLLWVESLIDLYFMQVQGSGVVELPDKTHFKLGYHGTNGHIYASLGRLLIQDGHLEREKVSMQSIKDWLSSQDDQGVSYMNKNPSYVFFTNLADKPIVGSHQSPLQPMRSIAVDTAFIPLGLPVWLSLKQGKHQSLESLHRLVMSQDTGGAIRGPNRLDLFVGFGENAGEIAGNLQEHVAMYLLLPKKVTPTQESKKVL